MTAPLTRERPVIRVLSVDGGGIRGLLPTRTLVALERMTGRPVADLFDLVAGTSTGGLVAMSLVRPGADGRPAMTAVDLLRVYADKSRRIFPETRLRAAVRGAAERHHVSQRFGAAVRPERFGNARYRPAGLEGVLAEVFGETRLSQALVETVVPAYDMKMGIPHVFTREAARDDPALDHRMLDVACATAAAPTYFPPVLLNEGERELCLIDGGVVANNPSSLGYYEALRWESESGIDCDIVVVSLGTGHPPLDSPSYQEIFTRGWLSVASGMLGVVFDGTSELSDALLRRVIARQEPWSRYWRLQPELHGCSLAIDDASEGNLASLLALAERHVAESRPQLAEIAALLVDVPPPPPRTPPVPTPREQSSPRPETEPESLSPLFG